ncbi:MAG TPA: OmpH family outer membrane protein [Planctomycetota bacterium]
MRHFRTLLAVLVLLALASVLIAGAVTPAPSGTVCFVNLQRCLDEYPKAQAELQRMRDTWQGRLNELEDRAERLREMEGELAAMDAKSENFRQQRYELETAGMTLERDREYALNRLNAQRLELLVTAYKKIEEAGATVGRRQGYAAVQVMPDPTETLPADSAAAFEVLQRRTTLWVNPGFEITNDVVALLKQDA